jgi:phosphoglycerol transferase
VPALRRLAAGYDHAIAPGYCEACFAGVGAIGTAGLVWLAICAIAALGGAGGSLVSRPLFRDASLGAGIALAAGLTGGLGSAFTFLITPDIRAWNRISVFIAFFSLLAAALLLDALLAPLRARRHRFARLQIGAVLAAALIVGVLDQTTSADIPAYRASAREWHSDATFVAEIEARMPAGASIFQLPYVPFPEGYPNTPVGGALATYATKYEMVRGYVHSDTLRWSYGADKGRGSDWSAALAARPLGYVLDAAAAAGFDGIWLDRTAFTATAATRAVAAVRSILRAPPLPSPDGELVFFDLRPFAAVLVQRLPPSVYGQLRASTSHPPLLRCNRRPPPLPPDLAALQRADGRGTGSIVLGLTGPAC